jgi:RNA polymerase sigma-70 factor, ECF subfamily
LRRRRLLWLSIDDDALVSHPALREQQPGPEETALKHEKREQVQALLADLAPENRCAVIMRYWYDLSYEEIAAATGTTVSAVKSRLHRARLLLGQTLQTGSSLGARGERRGDEHAAATQVRSGMVQPYLMPA